MNKSVLTLVGIAAVGYIYFQYNYFNVKDKCIRTYWDPIDQVSCYLENQDYAAAYKISNKSIKNLTSFLDELDDKKCEKFEKTEQENCKEYMSEMRLNTEGRIALHEVFLDLIRTETRVI